MKNKCPYCNNNLAESSKKGILKKTCGSPECTSKHRLVQSSKNVKKRKQHPWKEVVSYE